MEENNGYKVINFTLNDNEYHGFIKVTKKHLHIIECNKDVRCRPLDKIKVKLKYPKIEDTENYGSMENVDNIFKLIISCIDYIMDGEEMHKTSDYTEEEVDTFLSSLSADQFKNITTFFETMPRVSKDITGKCGQCGKEQNKTLTGVQDFFG